MEFKFLAEFPLSLLQYTLKLLYGDAIQISSLLSGIDMRYITSCARYCDTNCLEETVSQLKPEGSDE